eukprot:6206374-Pleurochrysis_carterae.AAC.1
MTDETFICDVARISSFDTAKSTPSPLLVSLTRSATTRQRRSTCGRKLQLEYWETSGKAFWAWLGMSPATFARLFCTRFMRQNNGLYGYRIFFILDDQPTRVHTRIMPTLDRATQNTPESVT